MEKIKETVSLIELREIASTISEDEILDNLISIISLKRRREQEVRDISSQIIATLSSDKLAQQFVGLIELLRSLYAFIREEAEDLLNKIDPELIFNHFEYLQELENDSNYCVQRFARKTMLKIALAWPLKEKKIHHDLIVTWQLSGDKEKVKVANFLILQLMKTWEFEKLELAMPFLVKQSDVEKNDIETVELAVSLAFKFLSKANICLRLKYLDYMTGFSDYGVKEIRRGFRRLALDAINSVSPKTYSKYALFFLRCLEAKNKEDQTAAWKNLLMINPDDLPVCQLVYCQVSGLSRVRRAGKKLAKKVSANVLYENLEEFLELQSSSCYDVKHLARYLITKIPLTMLRDKRGVLEKFSNSRYPGQSNMAWALLEFC